eukprot:Nitzschia sp. Nitz4//scaffold59_size112058//30038//33704//NITZ4_004104-RA/size112058-snap-gene-0.61-mRNA-1//-1//CDS//3329555108//1584//frame0
MNRASSRPTRDSKPTSQYESERSDDDSRSGSGSGTSSSRYSDSRGNRHPDEFGLTSGYEQRAVRNVRWAVVTFMLLCTVGASVSVFKLTRNKQHEHFKEDFSDYSSNILDSMSTSLHQSLSELDSLTNSAVSYAAYTNMTWPFVVIPNIGTRIAKVRGMTQSAVITMATLVYPEHRYAWDEFSLSQGPSWVRENLRVQRKDSEFHGTQLKDSALDEHLISPMTTPWGPEFNNSLYVPQWQAYPTASTFASAFNFDLLSDAILPEFPWKKGAHLSNFKNLNGANPFFSEWVYDFVHDDYEKDDPISELYYPIFDDAALEIDASTREEANMVGLFVMTFYWRNFLVDILPHDVKGIKLVIENTCNNTVSFSLDGHAVTLEGVGDVHKSKYENMKRQVELSDLSIFASTSSWYTGLPLNGEECQHTIRIYPSETFEELYVTNQPFLYAICTVAIFMFTGLVFFAYDYLVEKRQKEVAVTALKNAAIVSSLFPSNVRSRLFEENGDTNEDDVMASQKKRLKRYMSGNVDTPDDSDTQEKKKDQPIADLFPEATVMFGDIAGFTAWSSTREPSQVFTLLENLYGEFDRLASKRGVFKVETIGDCYVAVAGLPDPKKDHAIVMSKFARDCSTHMITLLAKLSVQLGPDTEDLSMRFGLNSGPVTAGVLRGQKSRFQLFGDTVNTASRMESLGKRNHIHVSQSTADELIRYGKSRWVRTRQDKVEVKGKGVLPTYWVYPSENAESTHQKKPNIAETAPVATNVPKDDLAQQRLDRLVAWNVDVLARLIRNIVTRRIGCQKVDEEVAEYEESETSPQRISQVAPPIGIPMDEVTETIYLPDYDARVCVAEVPSVTIDDVVIEQLEVYVKRIAATYHDSQNPFHNFEHASHVCMSVSKLMSRIVNAEHFLEEDEEKPVTMKALEQFKHERTFGLTSDPLALFACAFSALIHDVDHPGVPNAQLVAEGTGSAKKYKNRSVAEQRSVDIAWDIFLEDRFRRLRESICGSANELSRFRQLVVNNVLATDVMDKELKEIRNNRWNKAFDADNSSADVVEARDIVNRKATIVMEYMLQASDVAHTMQHWHIYVKWNKRLFFEMYQAYQNGRAGKDPSEFWYNGEMSFFDFYIIPLAKKLSDCGVFGVSSHEYLTYALRNREEWERKGKQMVAEMMAELGGGISN